MTVVKFVLERERDTGSVILLLVFGKWQFYKDKIKKDFRIFKVYKTYSDWLCNKLQDSYSQDTLKVFLESLRHVQKCAQVINVLILSLHLHNL